MDELNEVSAVEELTAVSEVVELPVPQGAGGKPFRIRITAPPLEAILEHLKSYPVAGTPAGAENGSADEAASADKNVERTAAALERLEQDGRVMFEQLGAKTEPPIVFEGSAPGTIAWRNLHVRNRAFLVRRVVMLAGLGPTSVDRLATFRPERGGGATGPAGDGGLPAAEVAP